MANQYTKFTAENVERKVNRKKNPVASVAELAREFGQFTNIRRGGYVSASTAAPGAFRNRLIALIGEKRFKQIRQDMFINKAYR